MFLNEIKLLLLEKEWVSIGKIKVIVYYREMNEGVLLVY